MKKIIIVGGGFAGLNAAKILGNKKKVEVTLIDRRNYHLFQPLLYQVAMAALSPAEIAAPIRNILSKYLTINILQKEVINISNLPERTVRYALELLLKKRLITQQPYLNDARQTVYGV